MDSVKRLKLQAMKNHKKGRFVCNLSLCCLTGLACSLFYSYPFCFSSLSASTKHFLFIYLPCIWSSFSNPTCLFIVANVIVAFLVGESNLFVGSSSSSPSTGDEYYDEYVERSGGVSSNNSTTLQERKAETKLMDKSDHQAHEVYDEVDKKVILEEEEKKAKDKVAVEKDDDEERDNINGGEEEPGLLPAEELNKRIEDFIARVNKQRWLEARSLLRCQA